MTRGCCFRCSREGEIELDHPFGTVDGCHLYPDFVVPLCRPCHRLRSLIDQRVGVEGAVAASAWLIVRRLTAWFGWLAMAGRSVPFESSLLGHFARVLEDLARMLEPDDGEQLA